MAVLGFGGFFFRSRDPKALAAWYLEHLGVGAAPGKYVWETQAGPTVFQPFKQDTDYFAADKAFMLNFRVSDLAGMIEKLKAANIPVETRAEWDSPETGHFARIHDPEWNAIELWEPSAK
ncbi:MAG TPA: VOC family protein [Alphaproteobacteria bacterium]|jgi:predicted enzyme related to lactoylglutathione lyase|nr:VOC family protein [Alphaproteobacteria bacterium]